jgi:hypothetical protein
MMKMMSNPKNMMSMMKQMKGMRGGMPGMWWVDWRVQGMFKCSENDQYDQYVQEFNGSNVQALEIILIPSNQTFTQSYAAKWAEMRLVSIHLLRRHSTASADNRAIEP